MNVGGTNTGGVGGGGARGGGPGRRAPDGRVLSPVEKLMRDTLLSGRGPPTILPPRHDANTPPLDGHGARTHLPRREFLFARATVNDLLLRRQAAAQAAAAPPVGSFARFHAIIKQYCCCGRQ
jgi:hypothetical protein